MNKWQPIENAPRDGTRIIVAKIEQSGHTDFGGVTPPHVWFAVTASHNGKHWTDGIERLVEPTHWMPVPPVP